MITYSTYVYCLFIFILDTFMYEFVLKKQLSCCVNLEENFLTYLLKCKICQRRCAVTMYAHYLANFFLKHKKLWCQAQQNLFTKLVRARFINVR